MKNGYVMNRRGLKRVEGIVNVGIELFLKQAISGNTNGLIGVFGGDLRWLPGYVG
jgi:hypothetical protein